SENRATTEGGGIYSLYGRVQNCTVVGNSADIGGGCIWVPVQNSILFGNTARTRGSNYIYNSSIAYSCAQPVSAGIGNFAEDPRLLFLGSPRIASDSPCIDAGSDALTPGDWDIDGEPRIWGGGVDVGCDELYPPGLTGALSVALSANFNRAVVGYPVRFQHAVWGKAEGFRLDFGDGQVVSNQLAIVHPFGTPGIFNAVLTGWNQDGSASATTTVQVFGGYTNYVSLGGGHESPYTNWPAAATTLQDAVSANIPGGVIVAADGVYEEGGVLVAGGLTNRVALTNGVTLRSLNGPAAAIVKGAGPVGAGAVRCAYVGPDSRLVGFTLTNGHTRAAGVEFETHGGGVLAEGSGLLSHCVLAGNAAAAGGGGGRGGAYWNCAFSGNTAMNGGGIFGGVLENCRVLANTVSSNGGGALGGSLRNCLVADNAARYGGGTAWATNTHVTIARNQAGFYGGGVYRSFAVNSVIFHNSASNGWPEFFNSVCDYSCTQPDPAGTGNITNDPQCVDVIGGDFRLADGSPCVDAGQDGHAAADLDSVPRPLDGDADSAAAPDMGAYERVSATADTDADGLSDSNELYGVGTSPVASDTDGDDQSDGGEIVGGTDPLDEDSYFVITFVRPLAGNGPAFYWPGVAGRLYTVVGTTSLQQEWSNFPAYVDQPGFDGTMGFTNTTPSEFDFYGVRVRMTP
ncbi:MAG TPA: choice-of-anchor Q domain-containing protein, partial [Kiritimatiellia bacterium]|nr:choice-of-anchor Q domain-containing protein [Kiritimatiellia bacterium]